jgi:VWFA-related protein
MVRAAIAQASQSAPEDPSNFVIRKTVRRVVLDVVVTGMDHKANLSLSANDFRVTEDGVPQRILSFEKHDFEGPASFVPPKVPQLPPNTFVDLPPGPERGPLNVILYDAWSTSMDDQLFGRQQMVKFICDIPEGARFAIFLMYDTLREVQGFTSDKTRLIAAADSRSTWPKVESNADSPLGEFIGLVDFLARLPGRKNIFWLSDRFPAASFAADAFTPAALGGCRSAPGLTLNSPEAMKALTNKLTQAQIAIYPIDLRGVSGGSCTLLQYMDEQDFAKATGGRAFYSRNDVAQAMGEALNEADSFYTLTYAPTNEQEDGKARAIHVDLNKPGFSLAYRRFYFGTQEPPAESHASAGAAHPPASMPLVTWLEDGASMRDLFFFAHVDERANSASVSGKTSEMRFGIRYIIPRRQFTSAQAGDAVFETAVVAFDNQGNEIDSFRQQVGADDAPAGDNAPADRNYVVEQEVAVPSKAVLLRVGIEDLRTNKMGSLEVPLPLK